MQILIFDIEAEYAHFRSFETTRGNISYPFPPRTAIIGLIAGILGIPRNTYWESGHPLRKTKLAIEVVKPIKRYGLKVNYTRTRESTSLGSGTNRVVFHFPNKPIHPESRGYITQVRLDLLKDVYYRVYCNFKDPLFTKFVEAVKNHHYIYPPYLGHANLLARVSYISLVNGKLVSTVSATEVH
ncbi:MAG: CRISPR-associated protein Cas5, partial [Candidatus Hodarchaeales archaeon]